MKKILSLLLVATLIFSFAAFVACQEVPETPDTETTAPEGTDGTEGTGTEQEETPLDAAVEYVRQLYKDTTVTPLDYNVATSVQVAGVAYSITWTVDTDKITITPGENGTATVDLPEKGSADLAYVLTATVADAAGATKSISFNRVVPKFAVNTWAEYFAAETGATGLVIEGVVTGIVSKTVGATNNCIFVQDTDEQGGYYVYGMTDDPVTLGIEIGMTVRVSGDKDIYNGTHEIKNAAVEILSTEKTPVTPIDLTEAYKAAADTKAAELVNLQGALVTLKGVEITTVGDNGYHNFTLAGKETYMRISGSTCAMSKAEQDAYTALHTASRGCTADITGIVSVYSGKFYLVPVVSTAATLSNVKAVERTPAEKVAYEADALTLATAVHMNSSLDLTLAGATYTDVTIAWTSDNACAVVTGNKLVITLQAEAQTVKVTATVTLGENTATKEFTIAVDAKPTVVPAVVDTPVAGTAYKFMLTQLNKGQNLFADGAMNGFYFNTTTDYNEGIDVYLEATEGGYYLYTMVGTDKTYISIEGVSASTSNDGKEHVNIIYSTTVKTVYTWNAEYKTLTTEITGTDSKNGTYYIGTYGTYTTFSASLISKIETSFPAHLVTMIDAAACTHSYAGDCDTKCDLCDAERTVTVEHTWTNACDADCNVCGATRTPADHVYDNACDTACNVCDTKRTTQHVDADNDNKCDVCGANISESTINYGTLEAPITTTQALKFNETLNSGENSAEKFFVKGVITAIGQTGNFYKNVYITDGTTEFLIYTINLMEGMTSMKVGDTITANGYIKNYNGTIEMAGVGSEYVYVVAFVEAPAGEQPEGGQPEGGQPEGGQPEGGQPEGGQPEGGQPEGGQPEGGETKINYGTLEAPITTTQAVQANSALASGEVSAEKFFVQGVITAIGTKGSFYKNVYITDGTTEFLIYTINLMEGMTSMKVGDTITAHGFIKNYNGTIEMANNGTEYVYVVAFTESVCEHTYSDATCAAPKTCTNCGATEGEPLPHAEWNDATCTTPKTCKACGATEGEALGHTDVNPADGTCDVCQKSTAASTLLATFDFGANGEAAHVDGKGTDTEFTADGMTLTLTDTNKYYTGSYDAKGNSCLKLGTGSVAGEFKFTVAANVNKVVIYVAKYKANTTKISVNGVEYTLTKNSNDGEYDAITIDTSSVKTVQFTTVSGGLRCMINTIEYWS